MPNLIIYGHYDPKRIIRSCILTDGYKASLLCATLLDALSIADKICGDFNSVMNDLKNYMPGIICELSITEAINDDGMKIIFENGSSIDCIAADSTIGLPVPVLTMDPELNWTSDRRPPEFEYDVLIADPSLEPNDIEMLKNIFKILSPERGYIETGKLKILADHEQRDEFISQTLDDFLAKFKITERAR